MEAILVLLVINLAVLIFAGFVLGLVALWRAGRLRRRLDDLEKRHSGGPTGSLEQRLRDLEERVAGLEAQPAASPGPGAAVAEVQPQEVVSAAPPARPQPPSTPADRPSVPQPPAAPAAAPAPRGDAAPPPSRVPPAAPRARRPRIEWERWIGVRGAAAAGGIVLALAALLFFQYSIERGLISPTMRVVLGVIAGIVCLVGSEWLVKRSQAAAANALAGAAVVILYGATWAARNLYGLIGVVPAFGLMVLVTVVCVALAVSRKAGFIAVLGLLGGFATPLLVASEVDSPAALFGYILLLDLGLLWLARARGWNLLAILSLVGTALHQALWILGGMDAERAALGIVILAVFGVVFLLAGSGDREPSRLWRATRAGGVAIPFAFAVHFAGTTRLAENPWPLGGLLLILSAGACWLERRQTRGAAVAAAGASLGVMALWFLNHRVSPALAWQAVGLVLALAALFAVAAEIWRREEGGARLGNGALVSALGFLVLLVLAAGESRVPTPWPWLIGWVVLGAGLVLHSRWQRRAWIQLAAGFGPAVGLAIAVAAHGRGAEALEPWAFLALTVAVAIPFQFLALTVRTGEQRSWSERTAAVTALALMLPASVQASLDMSAVTHGVGAALILGLLAALSATRARSGVWYLAATVSTAFWQTVVLLVAGSDPTPGARLGLLAVSAVLFTAWPALVPGAFRDSRSAWWGAALAGPLWFVALRSAFVARFGDAAIGVLPIALAALALGTVLAVRPRLAAHAATRRAALVWYLAVALSLVSVAIPLQLNKEWITIGWALNGLAILLLWTRLDHPGLKYFGMALLGAATVRLIANPDVLSYHLRSGAVVVNWLTYTYLVPAVALVVAHRLLKAKEVGRLTAWEERLPLADRALASGLCGLAAVAVVFVWINLAIADVFGTGSTLELSLERLPARDAATSVAWAVYALVLLAIGVRSRSGSLRWLSLGLLVLTLGKVFLRDLGELEDLYRVGSLVGLALSLIVVSLVYQRFVFRSISEEDE